MSLLLDALKKAALDKKHREQLHHQTLSVAESDSNDRTSYPATPLVSSDASQADRADELFEDGVTATVEAQEPVDMDLEIDADALDQVDQADDDDTGLFSHTTNASDTAATAATELDLVTETEPPEEQQDEHILAVEPAAEAKQQDAAQTQAAEPTRPDTQRHEFSLLDDDHLPPAGTPTQPAPDEPAATAPRRDSNETNATKAALNQLLTRSHRIAARNRRRKILLLSLLSMCTAGVVGSYYFFLNLNQVPTFPAIENRSAIAPVSEEPTDDNDEISTEQAPVKELETAPLESAAAPVKSAPVVAGAAEKIAAPAQKDIATNAETATPAKSVATKPETTAGLKSESTAAQKPKAKPISQPKSSADSTARDMAGANIQRHEPAPTPLSLAIQRGYRAYQQGDLTGAKTAYDQALSLSPHHRDALLGAAAVALRQGRQGDALQYYQTRLARDPRDEYARAGILSLASLDQVRPEFESEVNNLLRDFPRAAHLHFLKGAIHAARQQWGSAQLSFFEAWRWDNSKADYAYNLAVSLDHLQQPAQAAEYYRQALALAADASAHFDRSAAQRRLAQLEAQPQ